MADLVDLETRRIAHARRLAHANRRAWMAWQDPPAVGTAGRGRLARRHHPWPRPVRTARAALGSTLIRLGQTLQGAAALT